MRRKKQAFTLTELLVMIAMAGMFAAVLMPALSEEGEKENAVICKNNLRRIGRAIELYKQDNDGWYPASYTLPYGSGNTTGWTWREAIWDGYMEMQREPGHFPGRTPEAFNCPSDRSETQAEPAASYNMNNHYYSHGGETFYDGLGYNTGYGPLDYYGARLAGAEKRPAGEYGSYWTLESWVEEPSGTIAVLDGRSVFYGWRYYDRVRGPADLLPPETHRSISPQGPKHDGRYNFLFCDGSVRPYELEETVGTGEYDLDNHRALGMWTKTRGD